MMTRRHVLVLVPLSVFSVVTTSPLFAAQERKPATVTLIIEGMT